MFFKRSGYHFDTLGKIKIQNAAERAHKGKRQHCQKLIAPDSDVPKTAKPHTAAKQSRQQNVNAKADKNRDKIQ